MTGRRGSTQPCSRLFPLAIAVTIVFAQQATMLGNVAVAAAGCGLLYWMTGVARDRGKRLEAGLFRSWGGKPSIQVLRHRNEAIDPVTKARLHAFLADQLGVDFPTAADEADAPANADRLYESATRWLLEQTRDTGKHGLLFTENNSYGFRRNMLGVRWVGLASALLSFIWLVLDGAAHLQAMPTDLMGQLFALPSAHRVGLLASASAVALWTLGVSEERVRGAAFSYAERLVAACDVITGQSPAGGAARSSLPTPLPNRAAAG